MTPRRDGELAGMVNRGKPDVAASAATSRFDSGPRLSTPEFVLPSSSGLGESCRVPRWCADLQSGSGVETREVDYDYR